jgi:hypothetical protein
MATFQNIYSSPKNRSRIALKPLSAILWTTPVTIPTSLATIAAAIVNMPTWLATIPAALVTLRKTPVILSAAKDLSVRLRPAVCVALRRRAKDHR